jgi:alcohol dehydrogenase YqhD (iron-dependent ADH family)
LQITLCFNFNTLSTSAQGWKPDEPKQAIETDQKCEEIKMLGNFSYSNPTKLYFGEDSLKFLNEELPKFGKNVLLVYGGGSIKSTGLYDKVINILQDNGKDIFEDDGVMPNPTVEKLYEGCARAKANDVELILAVGGGSVCDYAKAVSVSTFCDEDPWDKYFLRMEDVENKIIPVGCILTMVGTGSEMNGGSVITNHATKQKIGHVFGENVFPKFSILNPVLTYTVPQYQMVAGFFDIMSHILEQYFSGEDDNTSDYIMEGLLKSLIYSSKIAVKNPEDYEARSNIMWTATWALNTLTAKGKPTDWMVHMIGQSIGAYTDATHGMTLSAISMAYYRFIMPYGLHKFKRYAINVWNVNPEGKSDEQIAIEGLDQMEAYMKEIGLVMSIKELGATEEMLDGIAKGSFVLKGGYKIMPHDEIVRVLRNSLV